MASGFMYGAGSVAEALLAQEVAAAGERFAPGSGGREAAAQAAGSSSVWASGGIGRAGLHAVVGCVQHVGGGGKCGQGALSAGFAEVAGPMLPGEDGSTTRLAGHIVVGGVGSVLGGGKFKNGAITGAFGYLFNYCQHAGCSLSDSISDMFGSGANTSVGKDAAPWWVGFVPGFDAWQCATGGATCSVTDWGFAAAGVIPGGSVSSPGVKGVGFAAGKWLTHFEKHQAEFGYRTSMEYLQGARALTSGGHGVEVFQMANRDYRYYRAATNEFAAVSPSGVIRTYFKPRTGYEVWPGRVVP